MQTIEASRALAHPHPRPEWFSGPVFVQELNGASDAPELEVLAVFFEAGARTMPHVHSTDQLLVFVEGEGVGEMAAIPADEWHWHGATPDSSMCHLSIRPGGPSVWAPDVPMHDWDTYMSGEMPG